MPKFKLSKIPGWLIMLLIFGTLYITGLHTEVLGTVQSVVLATGLIKPDIHNDETLNIDSGDMIHTASAMAGKDLKMRSLSGESITLESLYGKTIFLNLWATWCAPCIAEMPNIQKVYDKVKSEDIEFVMLSLDHDPKKAEKFIARKAYTFPVYVPVGQLPNEFKTSVIPTTFVISPEGKIVVKKEGMADYNTKEFIDFLKNLK